MKRYHFVKFNNTWYLKAESEQDIKDHFNTIMKAKFVEGIKDYRDSVYLWKESKDQVSIYRAHPETDWNAAVTTQASCKGSSWMEAAHELENKTYNDRLELFRKGAHIYLLNGLGYAPLKEQPKYQDEVWSEELVYPVGKLDINRVRYIQWDGGKHWYAKIDNIDIVDENGNQKWDTKDEAVAAAAKYILNNYK